MVNKVRVEGFIKQSTPAFWADNCYFVAIKNSRYYLITVKMDSNTYSEKPLNIIFNVEEEQRNQRLSFNKRGLLEFQRDFDYYLFDIDGNIVKRESGKKDLDIEDSEYNLNIVSDSYEVRHFQDDEWCSATCYFKEATIFHNGAEVLKLRFEETHFEYSDISIYGVIGKNVILTYYGEVNSFYLVCNMDQKIINVCHLYDKPIMSNYSIKTGNWKIGNIYQDFYDVLFSFDKKCIVYWGTEGKVKKHLLNDLNYVLDKGKKPNKYAEILCFENKLQIYKSEYDNDYFHYTIGIKQEEGWRKHTYNLYDTTRFIINSRKNAYAVLGGKVLIFVSENSFRNLVVEFDVPIVNKSSTKVVIID